MRPFITHSPEEVHQSAVKLGAVDRENDWGGLVRPHVLLMAGEHADSAEKLVQAIGGKILEKQQNRDQVRYLVSHGGSEFNILVAGLGAESVESALREYNDALKTSGSRKGYVIRMGSAGGLQENVNIGDSFIVNEGLDFSAATSFSERRRTHPIPRVILGMVPRLKRHLYNNFGLTGDLQKAAGRLSIVTKTGRCASVGTFGHFVMRRENGGIVPVRSEWGNASAVKTYSRLLGKIKAGAQDMESAAIAAYIKHSGMNLKYGAVLGISDHLLKPGEWHPFNPLVRPFMIAVEAILGDIQAK